MSPITFVTVGLTAGAALAAIPVIIHLIMRQTPKHVIFPALRLIKERQKKSRKRLRIRNWLLLLARMALIALMALALARPKLFSQTSLGDREVPTALGLVFDTSYSMQYTEEDKTRLREAQERAQEILGRTHESSQVFVVDSAEPGTPGALSPAAARKRVDALTLRYVNRKLNATVGQAYRAVAATDLPRREVYVFTDLARTAWDLGPGKTVEGLDEVKKAKEPVATYVVRLAPKELRDVAVVEAEAVGGLAIQDEPVTIRAKLRSTGPAVQRRVELWIDGTKRSQKEVAIPANSEVEVPGFDAIKLSPGLHQGKIRLAGEPDPLPFDDERHFTLDVQPALKVLVVSDRAIDRFYVANALDPAARPPGASRSFHVTQMGLNGLVAKTHESLRDFASIFLLNVREVPDSEWSKLTRYVRDGGGLVVALGDRTDPKSYNSPLAAALLPASLDEPFPQRLDPPQGFGDGDWSHPLLSVFRQDLPKDLSSVLNYRRASVKLGAKARTLLSFQDKAPALLEKTLPGTKSGRVLLWTTALARRAEANEGKNPEAWTEFPYVWSFLAILNQTVPYLAGLEGRRLTYEAGSDVELPVEPGRKYTNYSIQGPESKSPDRLTEPPGNAALVIVAPQQVGPWTVTATGPEGANKKMGFSINPPQNEERITPLDERELQGLFGGKDGFQLAGDGADIKDVQRKVRVGREIFPWLMALILALVTAENFLANRFYREGPAAPSPRGDER